MSETQECWLAIRTRDEQEFVICKSLSRLKPEEHLDVDYYLPTRVVVSQSKYRRKRSEVPVIHNLISTRTTKQTTYSLPNVYDVRLSYMKDLFTHSMLAVPDRQIPNFMSVMDLNPDGVSFDNGSLVVGDRMCVVKGDLTGAEGEVATNANRMHVVIRIRDVPTASVKVSKSYLKIIK